MSILGLVLKFERRLLAFFLDFSVGCPNITCLHLLGILWSLVIDNLTIDDVSSFFLLFKSLAVGYDLVSSLSEFLCDFSNEIKSLGWI